MAAAVEESWQLVYPVVAKAKVRHVGESEHLQEEEEEEEKEEEEVGKSEHLRAQVSREDTAEEVSTRAPSSRLPWEARRQQGSGASPRQVTRHTSHAASRTRSEAGRMAEVSRVESRQLSLAEELLL